MLASLRHYLSEVKKLSAAQIEIELRTVFVQQEVEAVITERSELPREAYEFFGLKRDPFDPRDPSSRKEEFTTPAIDKIARKIEDVIRYQGFLAIIGDIGSGKTILKRRIGEIVSASNGKLVLLWPEFFNMDKVHSGSIVYYLLHHFQERAPQDLISRAATLKKLLATLSDQGIHVALGFDECHRLDKRLIIALINFWVIGSGGYDRYLGVLLFGWPSFEFILNEHREIQERVNIVRMPGLGKNASAYLDHRIRIAGSRLEKLFEPAAISRILKWADTPLAIGNVANAALLKAFKLQESKVKAAFVPEKNGDPQVRGIRTA
jgi:type II secretory pathway predicted ATPase ExeA